MIVLSRHVALSLNALASFPLNRKEFLLEEKSRVMTNVDHRCWMISVIGWDGHSPHMEIGGGLQLHGKRV